MKPDILLQAIACIAVLTLSSCHKAEEIAAGFDKNSYECYLRNESGQDVTVIMRPSRHASLSECTWVVPEGAAIEIPETEKWGLGQRAYESDTVFFNFADGTSVLHYYLTEDYPSDKHTFVPATHNIFCFGLDIPDNEETWTCTKIRPHLYREEYVIR